MRRPISGWSYIKWLKIRREKIKKIKNWMTLNCPKTQRSIPFNRMLTKNELVFLRELFLQKHKTVKSFNLPKHLLEDNKERNRCLLQ